MTTRTYNREDSSFSTSIRDCFSAFDSNNDGYLTPSQLKDVLRALNTLYSEDELDKLSRSATTFDFYEVAALAKAKPFNQETVMNAFAALSHGESVVSSDLLRSWLQSMGEELRAEEVDELLRVCDIPTGGSFDIEQFMDKMAELVQENNAALE